MVRFHPALTALALLGLPQAVLAQDADGLVTEAREDGRRVAVQPYIEAAQVLGVELDPGNDVFTYTRLAAGVDAAVVGARSAASASLRYERRIAYGDRQDADTLSGVARGALSLANRAVTLEAGALASRTNLGNGGVALPGAFGDVDNTTQVYSVYAGPSVQFQAEDVLVQGNYRVGYTRVDGPDAPVLAPGTADLDFYDDSVTHSASVRASSRPYTILPVGLGVGAGWNEQHVSNFDQRIRDRYARVDVTAQLAPTVAAVAGVGYEDVEVSSRDALRDADGVPIVGTDGRIVTDESGPRLIAYDTDGLIWDVGVMWRPSTRTSLSATVGRRYGSMTYYGNFSYAPSARSSVSVSVYDSLTSFGGVLVNNLAALPTDFEAFRSPISGELVGCVISSEQGGCGLANFGSLRSAVFRNRGVTASYSHNFGRMSAGIAGGFDRRRFIGAAGTPIAYADGVSDESAWLAAYARRQIDEQSDLTANANVNWFDSGVEGEGSATGYSVSLAYYRRILQDLTGTAAVGLDGITRDSLPDYKALSALLGLRYNF